jgi:Beta propeller domain
MRMLIRLATLVGMLSLAPTAFQAQGAAQDPWPIPPTHSDPLLDPLTATRLETFSDTAAYREWIGAVQAYARDRQRRIYDEIRRRQTRPKTSLLQPIAYTPQEEICTEPECLTSSESDSSGSIVVTGSRVGASPSSASASSRPRLTRPTAGPNITNVQTAGVDEGDVVKQIGDYLAVLQDGRIFLVDIRAKRLALADRINVYTSKRDNAWYDEMLVEGNRIVITAYSYGRQATEISVFRLNEARGKLEREGRFYISSYDYYDGENYASRIVGDNLVLYTLYDAALVLSERAAPRLWRWTPDADGKRPVAEDRAAGRSLIDAGAVYRPVLRTGNAVVHVVTVCPLRSYQAGGVPACRVSAFAGPQAREFFVAPDAVYLWVGQNPWQSDGSYDAGDCANRAVAYDNIAPAAVYRIPVDGSAPGVVGLRGQPIDQFSMDMTRDTFRILARWNPSGCYGRGAVPKLAYANIGLGEFTNAFRPIAADRHVNVPVPAGGAIENRFADDWLVYGGRQEGYGAYPDGKPGPGSSLFVLPVDRPRESQKVALSHNVIRLERVGGDRMAAGGYRDLGGLDLSLLQLGGRPTILDTARLRGRFESEGRSHAFNSTVADDGSGILGLPTVLRRGRAMRYVWNSQGSDVSFMTMTPGGKLREAGALEQAEARPAFGYSCEVSCIDWYGNSRPIFTEGRIFALMATEIAEGRMRRDGIEEIQRINLTLRGATRLGLAGE